MNELEFAGKTAVITGATTGIGRGIGLALAARGAYVVFDHLDDEENARLIVDSLANEGKDALAVQADVSKPDEVKRLFAEAAEKTGSIDILVNNASVEVNKFIWDMSDEEYRYVMASSLDSVFYCSKYVLPYMMPHKVGKIVNISSIHDRVPRRMGVPYCAAKSGLLMMTETLALELAPFNIQVNAVSPGVVVTGRTDPYFRKDPQMVELRDKILSNVPARRAGRVEEIVAPVLFFCSDTSTYTTGTTIYIDGGYRHNSCPAPEADTLPSLEHLKRSLQ